jgi:cell volume regulation protein A
VESCITDALCVVVAMMMIELILRGTFNLGAPVQALSMAVGIGVAVGVVGAVGLQPMHKALLGNRQAYPVYLASFLIIYGIAQYLGGNGALSVLTTGLIVGNRAEILHRLWPNRFSQAQHVRNETSLAMHDQMTFFIKSFFFFLIGLMFPTSPRLILLGAAFAGMMFLFRIPAVLLSLIGAGFRYHQKSMISVAIPRGMAAGVLSAMPLQYGVPGSENISPAVFSAIVFSILIFSGGYSLVSRLGKGN